MSAFLSLTIKDTVSLYESYMPFLTGGGLFIPTEKAHQLGDEVFIRLKLMEDSDVIPVAGRVVWITPKGAQGRKHAGIGVQFTDEQGKVRTTIENTLSGMMTSEHDTNTM